MQTKLTTEYHVQPEEPGTQTLRVRVSEGGQSEVCESNLECHMPRAPFVPRRDLQDSKPRLLLLLAAHTDTTNNNNTTTLLRGATTTPKVSKARGVPNALPSTSFEPSVCASESRVKFMARQRQRQQQQHHKATAAMVSSDTPHWNNTDPPS
jgi:hypothetical protein